MASTRSCAYVQLMPVNSAVWAPLPFADVGSPEGSLTLRLPLGTTMAKVLRLLLNALRMPRPVPGSVVDTGRSSGAPEVLLYATSTPTPPLSPITPQQLPEVRRPGAVARFVTYSALPRHRVSLTRSRSGKRISAEVPSAEPVCAAAKAGYEVAPLTATLLEVCEAAGVLGGQCGAAKPVAEPTLRIFYVSEARFGGGGGGGGGGASKVRHLMEALKRLSDTTLDRDGHHRSRSANAPTGWASRLKRKLTAPVPVAGARAQKAPSASRPPSRVSGSTDATPPSSANATAAAGEAAVTPRSNESAPAECQDLCDVMSCPNPLTMSHSATHASEGRTASRPVSAASPLLDFDHLAFIGLPLHVEAPATALQAEEGAIEPANLAPPEQRSTETSHTYEEYAMLAELLVSPSAVTKAPGKAKTEADAKSMPTPTAAPVKSKPAVIVASAPPTPNAAYPTKEAARAGHGGVVSTSPPLVTPPPASPGLCSVAHLPVAILTTRSALANSPVQCHNPLGTRGATPDRFSISPFEWEQSSVESLNAPDRL